jgi:osmoprotectant transport system substrate-binding protein
VGKTIFIGHVENKEEEMVSNILSRLITERTGTSVKLKKYANSNALLNAASSGDIDLFVFNNNEINSFSKTSDFEKAKSDFNTRLNLVFLKPLIEAKNEYTVPIIRKDTLKKFPALPRLIEKLNGLINPSVVSELVKESEKRGLKDTVREFLKSKNLI